MNDAEESSGLTLVRVSALLVLMSIILPLVFITCLANGRSGTISGSVVALAATALFFYSIRALPATLDANRPRQRFLFAFWVGLSLFVSFRLAIMGVFMLDAEKVQFGVTSHVQTLWTVSNTEMKKPTHNCFTAGAIAADLAAKDAENIYLREHYFGPAEKGTDLRRTLGGVFKIDPYQYPPPFLILPRLILAIGPDFFQSRTYWFVFNVLMCSAAVVVVATWLGGHDFHVYWLIWPLMFGAPTMLRTLQMGNAHFLVVAISVTAMLAFEKNRNWLGGVLLAFAIGSKLFPSVLLLYFAVKRQWSAVLWTIGALIVLCLAVLVLFGANPLVSFLNYQVPRLVSGEAFDFMTKSNGLSVMSIPYKLEKLGLLADIDPAKVAAILTWLYTGFLGVVIFVVGTKHYRQDASQQVDDRPRATRLALGQVWLALLILAQLRSPALPWGYSNVPALWLLTLAILSSEGRSWRQGVLVLGWLIFAADVPGSLGVKAEAFDLAYMLTMQLLLLALCCRVIAAPESRWAGATTRNECRASTR